jgi:hypothetical protein
MLYFGGVKLKILIGMVAVGAVLVLAVYGVAVASGSDSYRVARILAFFNPEMYSSNDAYQMMQSRSPSVPAVNGYRHVRGGFHEPANYVPGGLDGFHLFHHR